MHLQLALLAAAGGPIGSCLRPPPVGCAAASPWRRAVPVAAQIGSLKGQWVTSGAATRDILHQTNRCATLQRATGSKVQATATSAVLALQALAQPTHWVTCRYLGS
jgi:hypothetical protein